MCIKRESLQKHISFHWYQWKNVHERKSNFISFQKIYLGCRNLTVLYFSLYRTTQLSPTYVYYTYNLPSIWYMIYTTFRIIYYWIQLFIVILKFNIPIQHQYHPIWRAKYSLLTLYEQSISTPYCPDYFFHGILNNFNRTTNSKEKGGIFKVKAIIKQFLIN